MAGGVVSFYVRMLAYVCCRKKEYIQVHMTMCALAMR